MSQKIRQGNDIDIHWSLLDADENPYILEGRNIEIELEVGKKRVKIRDIIDVNQNTVHFVYYGKDQKYLGSYNLKFIENNGEVDMVTFDTRDAFTMVEHSWLAIDEGETPETIQLEFVTISSNIHSSVGPRGLPAGFGEITVSVDDTVGTPSADVIATGPDTAKNLHFEFGGLKGRDGQDGHDGSDAEVTQENIANALGYTPVAPADIADFITKAVNDLVNYYTKSETYTRSQIQELIAAIQGVQFVPVATLPTASAETMGGKIYLVPSADPQTQNVKDEYVTLRSGTEGSYTYAWEKIGDTSVDVSGKADKVASAVSGNFAGLDGNGNLTDSGKKASDFLTQHQDISGKADKDTDAVTGNFAAFDASGNPVDSGKKASDFLTSHQDISGKADKVSGGTADNFAALDANGNLKDSGKKASDFATAAQGAKADTAYQKPVSGIPSTDLAAGVIPDVSGFYTKPAGGIPSTDLASGVQTSLGKADTAVQPSQTAGLLKNDGTVDTTAYGTYSKPSGGIPSSDMASAVQTSLGKADTAYQKPSSGIPANDLASGVIPSVPVTDVTVGGTSVVSDGTAVVPAIPTVPTISTDVAADKASTTKTAAPSAVYNEVHPATASSQPAGGMLPNVLYKLGTLTGSVTIAFATPADNTIENEYRFAFTADSTAPTITWPAAITKWAGNALDSGLPNVEASTYYEVSVEDGMGIFNKFE